MKWNFIIKKIAPKSIQNILKNKDVINAINKELKFLDE